MWVITTKCLHNTWSGACLIKARMGSNVACYWRTLFDINIHLLLNTVEILSVRTWNMWHSKKAFVITEWKWDYWSGKATMITFLITIKYSLLLSNGERATILCKWLSVQREHLTCDSSILLGRRSQGFTRFSLPACERQKQTPQPMF